MKKQYAGLLVVVIAVSGFLFSCGGKNKEAKALEFDSIQVNETGHLFGDTAKPGCNLVIKFVYPTKANDDMLKDSLNAYFISACFGDKYIGQQPTEVVKQYKENYITEYRQDLESMYAEDQKSKKTEKSIEDWYSYYKTIEGSVQYYDNNLLVYRINYNEYTGGAHGIYTATFLNMDLGVMRPLHLQDIFADNYTEPLTVLLWKQLMEQQKVTSREELEELGYGSTGEVAPTENFYLTKEGITFYYNVYDITPYTMGPVEIHLPYPMIAHLLGSNPVVKELRDL